MKAIVIAQNGGPENLCLTEYSKPEPEKGMVLIKVKAFGINRAEVYMRRGEWGETSDIIGIECVGVVEDDLTGRFQKGIKVAAVCGGMARTINGSYAEYVNVPVSNVVALKTALPWDELAAIPETYMTAWALLNWGLSTAPGDFLLIRGATSTLGQACIILARQTGLKIIATTRSAAKISLLKNLGADHVLIDQGETARELREIVPAGADHVIELVGNNTLLDSFGAARVRGAVCLAGFLGGMQPIGQFQPLLQIPSGLRFTTFGSAFVFGFPGFELSEIPLQKIVTDIEEGRIQNIYHRAYSFEDISEAHRLVETNAANGKIVVTV
jgi:NADPH2:quinone reductase